MTNFPRRNFIKQTSLLTGGLWLGAVADALAAPPSAARLKIGIIGCGDRGTGLLKILQELPDKFEVVALCDELPFRLQNAQKTGAAGHAKTYADYRALLDARAVEAVIIAVPLNLHFQVAKDALAAGKQVYLEKTMTYDIPQALELVRLARQRPNQTLQIGHQYRYSPLYYRVKEMIKQGYLGKVTQIDCRWDRNGSWRRPVPEPGLERKINWRMYREYSGGLAAELLSHQLDFINWAFDTHADEVFGTGGIDYYQDGRETYRQRAGDGALRPRRHDWQLRGHLRQRPRRLPVQAQRHQRHHFAARRRGRVLPGKGHAQAVRHGGRGDRRHQNHLEQGGRHSHHHRRRAAERRLLVRAK